MAPPPRAATLLVVLALASGCGNAADEGSAPKPETTSGGSFPAAVSPPRHVGGNLVNAAELELVSQQEVMISPGLSERVPLSFDDAPAASVVVLTNKPKDVSASIEGERLRVGDLFGVPTLFMNLLSPADSVLLLENEGKTEAAASVGVRVQSARKIELDVASRAVPPGEPVKLTAKVTEPKEEDVVFIRIVHDDRLVAELEPRRLSEGTWQTEYRAKEPGFYAITARVEGGPPRFLSGVQGFEVADRGTSILGFDERLVDADRDGLAEYLSVQVHFAVSKPGQYLLTAGLGDTAGKPLRTGGGGGPYRWLKPGRHTFELRWQAETLRLGGVPGPWRLVHVQLVRIKPNYRTESDVRDLGQTKPYPFSAFERGTPGY